MPMTYLVTACNRGLGLGFAQQLAARGDTVIATARDVAGATELAALDVEVMALDIADAGSVAALADELAGRPLDVLVNNAGIGVHSRPLDELEFTEMEQFFAINTVGTLRVVRALLPNLRAGSAKKIVNLTSKMGSIADNTGGAAYSYRASKAALNMVTRSLAVDLGGEGFICTVLHPGWVLTDMGGPSAPVQPEDSIRGMLEVIDGLDGTGNGQFFDFTGARVPW